MSKEDQKDFNKMLENSKDMPKIQIIRDEKSIKKYGGNKMLIASPLCYDEIMKQVCKGKLITITQIREYLAKKYAADFTDPMTAGIFINIVAWASYQRKDNITPYWRTLKVNGELNNRYPGGIQKQKEQLEQEGYTVIVKGNKNLKYFVKDFQKYLINI